MWHCVILFLLLPYACTTSSIYIYIHLFAVFTYTPTETLAYCTHFGYKLEKTVCILRNSQADAIFQSLYLRKGFWWFMQIINGSSDLSEV